MSNLVSLASARSHGNQPQTAYPSYLRHSPSPSPLTLQASRNGLLYLPLPLPTHLPRRQTLLRGSDSPRLGLLFTGNYSGSIAVECVRQSPPRLFYFVPPGRGEAAWSRLIEYSHRPTVPESIRPIEETRKRVLDSAIVCIIERRKTARQVPTGRDGCQPNHGRGVSRTAARLPKARPRRNADEHHTP
jgi:hypothetical protein